MSKERKVEEKVVSQLVYKVSFHVECDGCGLDMSTDSPNEDFANDLKILLNDHLCVNQRFRKDYCNDCIEPIWNKICELIGVDPDDMSVGYDEG